MKILIEKTGLWLDDLEAGIGEDYILNRISGGKTQQAWNPLSPDEVKSAQERQWRDSELLRTDRFVVIPDYPTDLLVYRAELRSYPAQSDFPNGTRPTL